MPERHVPPGGRPPTSELEAMLAQMQQHWRGFKAGPIIGLVGLYLQHAAPAGEARPPAVDAREAKRP